MRVLVVSPFPPLRDGVGKYAAQEVAALRAEGHVVEVLAPVPCAAHHVEDLKGGLRLLKLRRYARRYDRVILQYQPSHYHERGSGPRRLLSNLGMLGAFLAVRNLVVVCHEVEYPPPGRSRFRPELVVERLAWRVAAQVEFHTQREVEAMARELRVRPRRVVVRSHGRAFRPRTDESREEARQRLGIPPEAFLFLCIGFIQRHKGFDRAVRAFRRVRSDRARLVVVGSVREELPEHRACVEELRRLASADPRVTVWEQALSDREFDRWIRAADRVVLPYREIWSSGVLERAKVLGTPAILTDVGGLREQAREVDVVVGGDEELARAMARAIGEEAPAPAALTPEEAMRLVREEGALRRAGVPGSGQAAGELALAWEQLDRARGVEVVVLPSGRPLVGPLLDLAKRAMRRGLGWLTTPLLGQLNEFHRLTAEAFGAAVREVGTLRRELEARLDAAVEATQKAILDELGARTEELGGRVRRVEDELGRLERRTRALADALEGRPQGPARGPAPAPSDYATFDYHRFEGEFRGDPAAIKEKQRTYLDDFLDAAPVLDVGCGRGEFLELLREAGVEARGVDVDLDMVAECRQKGLDVVHGDAIAYLEGLPEGSLGGIMASQVVEHLPPRQLVRLLAAARRALRPGGVLVCETINPKSLFALANWYFMDLTHAQPVHPDTLRFLVRQEGFEVVEVRYLSPARPQTPALEVGPGAPPWARALAEELQQLNEVVFGPQDYALVARVPR